MSGTPREVFARGDELMTAGLDVPQVTRVAMALRDKGIAITPPFTPSMSSAKSLSRSREGAVKNAEGYHARPVFPGRHARP